MDWDSEPAVTIKRQVPLPYCKIVNEKGDIGCGRWVPGCLITSQRGTPTTRLASFKSQLKDLSEHESLKISPSTEYNDYPKRQEGLGPQQTYFNT